MVEVMLTDRKHVNLRRSRRLVRALPSRIGRLRAGRAFTPTVILYVQAGKIPVAESHMASDVFKTVAKNKVNEMFDSSIY